MELVPSPKSQIHDTGAGTDVFVKWSVWFEHVALVCLKEDAGTFVTSIILEVSEHPEEDCAVSNTL